MSRGCSCRCQIFVMAAKNLCRETSRSLLLSWELLHTVRHAHHFGRYEQMAKQMNDLLTCGHFNRRKWTSNCVEAFAEIPHELKTASKQHELTMQANSISTLGLLWTPELDILLVQLKLKPVARDSCTKRQAMGCIAGIYDPLGFLDPVKMRVKLIHMQRIWIMIGKDKKTWKWVDELPEQMASEWKLFAKALTLLETITISRSKIQEGYKAIQLHFCCDTLWKRLRGVLLCGKHH